MLAPATGNFPALFAAFSPKGPSHGASMKKPRPAADEPQPRKIIRADKAPTTGYSLVGDGHFKSHHDTVEAAEEAGIALKNRFQMLQVQVYDAENKTRSMIDWPGPGEPCRYPTLLFVTAGTSRARALCAFVRA